MRLNLSILKNIFVYFFTFERELEMICKKYFDFFENFHIFVPMMRDIGKSVLGILLIGSFSGGVYSAEVLIPQEDDPLRRYEQTDSTFLNHTLPFSMINQTKKDLDAPFNKRADSSELKIRLQNWTPDLVKSLLKLLSATDVYATFSMSTKDELNQMQNDIDGIWDTFIQIQNQLQNMPSDITAAITILAKDIELLLSYYKDCYDELAFEKRPQESVFSSCIKDLQELQTAVQNLRNSAINISEGIKRLMRQDANSPAYQNLKLVRKGFKTIADRCKNLISQIDVVINKLKTLLDVYHQYSYEERNQQNQSRRAISNFAR